MNWVIALRTWKAKSRTITIEPLRRTSSSNRTVWSYSGNRVLENTLERLCTSVLAFVGIQRHSAKESLRDYVGRHKRLLEVLANGKPKSISLAIREHLDPSHSIPSNVVD